MHLYLTVMSVAYLLGSIPFGFLLVLLVRKEDIRAKGSGNIGATNVLRSGAKGLGALTFFLDAGKGYAAVLLAGVMARHAGPAVARNTITIAAFCAIVGHVFPIWLRFKGGKGVATAFGGFLALSPLGALLSLGVFVAVAIFTRYVSVASILAAVALPFLTLLLPPADFPPLSRVLIVGSSVLVIAKHWQNMVRLTRGVEHRWGKAGKMSRIGIVGSGSWGTAIALSLERRGDHSISLWSHSAAVAESIREVRENRIYLPGHRIPAAISATTSLRSAIETAEIVIGVVPSQHARETYSAMLPFLNSSQLLVSATKGIEDRSFLRMTQVAEQVLGTGGLRLPCGVLSGPSFAQEVASGSPTAITISFTENRVATLLQEQFSAPGLRLYTNDDVVGVEMGGALKNVVAIAAGIASGLNLGHNSIAAIVTRGIAEITRLAVACGARRETLAGLSGLGDLVLTCTGPLSRNRFVGIELGRGRSLTEIVAELHGRIAEGMRTTSAAIGLARLKGVEMPITEQMWEILNHGKSPQDAIRDLMSRPERDE